MAISKNIIDRSDINTNPINIKYPVQNFGGYILVDGTNRYTVFTSSLDPESLVYRSIKQLYYNEYLTGSLLNSASGWDPQWQSTAAQGTLDADYIYFPTDPLAQISVIQIGKEVYGENIAKKSLSLSINGTQCQDDGNGNIVVAGTTSRIGNIFYSQGMIVITNPAFQPPLPSSSPAASPSSTPAASTIPALSVTPTPTRTPGASPSVTPTVSISSTPAASIGVSPSVTPTITPTISPTISITPTPTISITPTRTITPTPTPSRICGNILKTTQVEWLHAYGGKINQTMTWSTLSSNGNILNQIQPIEANNIQFFDVNYYVDECGNNTTVTFTFNKANPSTAEDVGGLYYTINGGIQQTVTTWNLIPPTACQGTFTVTLNTTDTIAIQIIEG